MRKGFSIIFLFLYFSASGQNDYYGNDPAKQLHKAFSIGLIYTYGAADPTQVIGEKSSYNRNNYYVQGDSTKVNGSYGAGNNVFLIAEYSLKKHFSFLIMAGYHKGLSYETSRYDHDNLNYAYSHSETEKKETHTFNNISQYQLNPEVKFWFGYKIRPYFILGFVWGFRNKMTEDINTSYKNNWQVQFPPSSSSSSSTSEITKLYSKGMTYGILGGSGLDCKISSRVIVFSEISYTWMHWSPQHSTITKYIENGVDVLPGLPSSTVNTDYGTSAKLNKPYNSINFTTGIRFILGEKE